jgi:uncharacterized membrane protein YhaH (DUF805 family)
MDWQRTFFSAQGRMGRSDFWIGYLILFGISALVGWIFPIGLAALYATVCLFAKRLHDAGRSAWLILIPVGINIIMLSIALILFGSMIFAASRDDAGIEDAWGIAAVFGLIGFGLMGMTLNLAFLIWVGASQPSPGDNRFGSPPLPVFSGPGPGAPAEPARYPASGDALFGSPPAPRPAPSPPQESGEPPSSTT